MFKLVKMMDQVVFFIVPTNPEITCMEYCTQFIADQIHNSLEVQLGGESLLNRVDDLQLCDAFLLGFKQSRVFDGDSHVRGKRLQEAYMVFGECVLAICRDIDG